MVGSQLTLLELLSKFDNKDSKFFSDQVHLQLKSLSDPDLADVFFNVAFIETAMTFLKDQHWLQKRDQSLPANFESFVSPLFKSELTPIAFLENYFLQSSLADSRIVRQKAQIIESVLIDIVKARTFLQQKIFATEALKKMAALFAYEIELQEIKKALGSHLGFTFYRTFDRLDEVLGLDYDHEPQIQSDINHSERLYAGGGVGVQSGYSTVITALQNLKLKAGDRIIDLGSGYGRVGFIVGLLREDLHFKGYEFVQHRVENAKTISHNLGLEKQVRFYTCDLSDKDFFIPEAEVYYLYDPFSEPTYLHVLSQLIAFSRKQKITIVTKGNARGHLQRVALEEGWPEPQEFDNGNLCLFASA